MDFQLGKPPTGGASTNRANGENFREGGLVWFVPGAIILKHFGPSSKGLRAKNNADHRERPVLCDWCGVFAVNNRRSIK